jgi:hypothetical protein
MEAALLHTYLCMKTGTYLLAGCSQKCLIMGRFGKIACRRIYSICWIA